MHEISDLYREIIAWDDYDVESAVQIGGNDPVAICTDISGTVYGVNSVDKLETVREIFGREAPSVGNFISGRLDFSMLVPETPIPTGARFVPYSRVVSKDGKKKSEWHPKGVYWADTRRKRRVSTTDITINIIAYDAAMRGEEDYDGTNLTWPAKDIDVLTDIADKLHVGIDPETFAMVAEEYEITEWLDLSIREMGENIAAAYGCNLTMDDFGNIRFIPLGALHDPVAIAAERVTAGIPSDAIARVVINKGNGEKFIAPANSEQAAGERTLNLKCPFATQDMADNILSNVTGYAYTSFQAKQAPLHPAIELGDTVAVCGITETVCTEKVDFKSYTGTVEAPEENEINHEYPYVSSTARGAARAAAALDRKYIRVVARLDDAETGLDAKINTKDMEDGEWVEANTSIFATIGEKTSAFDIWVLKNGKGDIKSGADLISDLITLKGDVKVIGNFTVDEDGIVYIKAKSTQFQDCPVGFIKSDLVLASNSQLRMNAESFVLHDYTYKGEDITSTDGKTHKVLGYV